VSAPSQRIYPSKSSARGKKQGQFLSKYKRKGDVCEWNSEKSENIQGRKRGRPLGCTNNSRASLSSPVRKSVRVSVRNKRQLPDTDKGTVRKVSIGTWHSRQSNKEIAAFRDIVLCSLIEVDQHFRGAYCLHCQGSDGGSMHLSNAVLLQWDYMVLYL
jgi:hypothetical protein